MSSTKISAMMISSFVGGACTGAIWRDIYEMLFPKTKSSEMSTSQNSQNQPSIANGNFVLKTSVDRKINMIIFGTAGENSKNTIKAIQGVSVEDMEVTSDPLKMMYSPFIFRILTEEEVRSYGKQNKLNYWRARTELKKMMEDEIRSDLPENLKLTPVSVLTAKDLGDSKQSG